VSFPVIRPVSLLRLPHSAPLFRTLISCLLGAAFGGRVQAQQVTDTTLRLRNVMIVRHDVYDSSEARGWSFRLINKLHVRTQQRVVERELLLHAGDALDSARAAETGRNLRRLRVFREVIIDTSTDKSTLRITTRDGWTTRPYATFRSSGRQKLFSLGVLETNFLGLAATLDARYVKDPDRSQLRLAVGAPRIIRNRINIGVFVNRLSDGSSAGGAIEQPFFSLSSRNSARLSFVTLDGRVLRFRDGNARRPVDSLDRKFSLGALTVSHALRASPLGYVRLGVDAQVRRDDFTPRRSVPIPISSTVTGAVSGYLDISRAKYLLTRNYRSLGPQEDVDLSTTVRLGLAVAPRAFGYQRNGIGPELFAQTGVRMRNGFAVVIGRMSGLASGGAIDSGTATLSGTIALQPSARQMLVLFNNFGWIRNPYPGAEFDIGLARGPRAFPLHAFTGDRQRFSLVEYRYTVLPRVLKSFAVGVAAFAENGGAWYSGSPRRSGSDVGIGLRSSPLRSADNIGASRFDLAYRLKTDRDPAGWTFVIGTGFTFDLLR
jgi:hypothetical protein